MSFDQLRHYPRSLEDLPVCIHRNNLPGLAVRSPSDSPHHGIKLVELAFVPVVVEVLLGLAGAKRVDFALVGILVFQLKPSGIALGIFGVVGSMIPPWRLLRLPLHFKE